MTELDLYKFITKNNLESHWVVISNAFEADEINDVVVFIPIYLLDDWGNLLGSPIFDEEGISCVMKVNYLCFMMQQICDYFDIEITKIFGEEKENS